MRGIISEEAKPEYKPGGLYMAKPGGWFDAGTIVKCVSDFRPEINSGIFFGKRSGKVDEEVCGFNEFEPMQSE